MLAVEPEDQDEGIGRAVTEVATDWLRGCRMQVAMVETGATPATLPLGACTRAPATPPCRSSGTSRRCKRSTPRS